MPDIFLSYNREDQAAARRFAEALEGQGYSVWWDTTLRTGEIYDKVTEQALSDAKAVVVLWSQRSVDSRWVRAEATQADRNGTLVPVMIEPCKRPIMFELTQTAELTHWRGDATDKAWLAFLSDLRKFVEKGAPSSSPSARSPSALNVRAVLSQPLVLGGLIAAGLAVVAAVALVAMRPQPSQSTAAPPTQRTAFFGFTTTSNDLIAVQMAGAATDETFKTMSALGLETVSGDKTSNVARGEQLTRAKELGALYALGGDVTGTSAGYVISIRLDDVYEQRTLWQDNTTIGNAAARISLPVAAAAKATGVLRCFASTHASLKRAEDLPLSVLASACARGDTIAGDSLEAVAAWRELAKQAKESSYVQGYLARRLMRVLNQQRMAAPARRALLEEARAAAQRALKLDSHDGNAQVTLAFLAVVDGRPRAEAEKLLVDGLKATPSDGALNAYYQNFLVGSGRYRDALLYASTAAQSDPLRPTYVPGMVFVNAGRPLEAVRSFDDYNSRLADPVPWNNWVHSAIFEGLGDTQHALDVAPASVSGDTVKCWRDIASAAASRDQTVRRVGSDRASECVQSRSMTPELGIPVLAALGDVDGAFALTKDEAAGRHNPIGFIRAPFFTLAARSMRADPKFLPLVKERGIWDYWIDTKTHPDVCDLPIEKDFEVCVTLQAAQTGK